MRVAGSHNYSRSAPALQSNVDLLSAKGSKEPIDSSHVSIIPYSSQQSKTTNNLITTITHQKPVRAFIFALDSLA